MGRDDRSPQGRLRADPAPGLDELAEHLLEEHAALPSARRAEPLGLCLSGGADSSALVLAASRVADRLGIPVTVLHAMHALRGTDSDRDRHACRELAARCGFRHLEVDAAVEPGPNLEERARKARYAALRVAHPGLLATAHHRGDQVETMVLRLLRGAGAVGLRGIHRLREDGVWRPFLAVPRGALERVCHEAGWRWRHDGSNADERHLRNWVRNSWLPAEGPAVEEALWKLAASCEALAPVLRARLDAVAGSCRLAGDRSGFRIDLSAAEAAGTDGGELDLVLHRGWALAGRRPWADAQRERLLADALSGGRGRRRGGQGEIAIWGGGLLQVRAEDPGARRDDVEVGTPADG